MVNALGQYVRAVLGLVVGIPIVLALSEEVCKAAADCTEPTRTLVLLLLDPTEYMVKWVIIAVGLIAYGLHKLSYP